MSIIYQQGAYTNKTTALLTVGAPVIPGTLSNPFTSGSTADFAISCLLTPQSGNAWKSMTGANQIVVGSGNIATLWYAFFFFGGLNGGFFQNGTTQTMTGSFNGAKLVGTTLTGLQPGTRNYCFGKQGGNYVVYIDSLLVDTVAVSTVAVQQPTMYLGQDSSGAQPLIDATLSFLRIDSNINRVLTPVGSETAGKQLAASFGDSITVGYSIAASQSSYYKQIADVDFANRYWYMAATGGYTITQIANYWNNWGINQGLIKATVMGGVNDLKAGTSAATIWTTYQAMLDSMRATSSLSRVVLCSVLPFGNFSGWTAAMETQRGILNTNISNYATSFPAVFKFADTGTALAQGGTPQNLNPSFDSGDGLHPNQAGQNQLYTTVKAFL